MRLKRLILTGAMFAAGVVAAITSAALVPTQGDTICVMSYNVHNAVGMDGIRDVRRIAGVIIASGADVVAVQEVDSVTNRSGGRYILGDIAAATGMNPVFSAAIDFDGGRYGIGLLSRERPLSVRRVPLPGTEEERTLLLAEFENYVMGVTHLSLTDADRLASVDILAREAAAFDKPLILAGDFNASPDSPAIEALSQTFTPLSDGASPTFPADNPTVTIDHIMYKGDNPPAVLSSQVVNEPMASDHRPVTVSLAF